MSRRRVMTIVIEHDDIGEEMFLRPVGKLLVDYGAMLITDPVHSWQERLESNDGFKLTAVVSTPQIRTRQIQRGYKDISGLRILISEPGPEDQPANNGYPQPGDGLFRL